MPNMFDTLIGRAKTGLQRGSLRRVGKETGDGSGGKVRLKDPSTVDPKINAGDLVEHVTNPNKRAPYLPEGATEADVVREVAKLYQQEKGYNAAQRQRWELYERFVAGEQYCTISSDKGIIDGRSTDEDVAEFVIVNILAPAVTKIVALVSAGIPEVEAIAKLKEKPFIEAAKKANRRLGHVRETQNISALCARQIQSACTASTAWRYWCWDKEKSEIVPAFDPISGQMIGLEKQKTGGICVQMLTAREVFVDSSARELDDAAYVILAQDTPLSELQTRFGDRAFDVKPDADCNSNYGGSTPYLTATGSLDGGTKTRGEDAARLLTFLVKPQPHHPQAMYRNGFYACVAGGVLLHASEWPWVEREKYPLAGIEYAHTEGTPYGPSLVSRLIDLQIKYNEEWRRIFRQLDLDKAIITKMRSSGPAASLYQDIQALKEVILVEYDMGTDAPTIGRGPQVNEAHFLSLDKIMAQVQELAGLPDVLEGAGAEKVDSGIQYDLMIKTATSVHRPLVDAIHQCEKRFAEGVLKEYAAKGPSVAVLSVDPYGNDPDSMEEGSESDKWGGEIVDFTDFNEMGESDVLPYDVYLANSSGADMSPDAKQNRLLNRFSVGLLGDSATPAAAKRYWSLSDEPEAQQLVKSFEKEEQAMAEQQQSMMEAEAQAGQGELELKQAEAQMKMDLSAAQGEQKMAIEREKAALQMQAEQQKLQLSAAQSEQQLLAQQQKQEMESERAAQSHAFEMQKAMDMNQLSMADFAMRQGMERAKGQQALATQQAADKQKLLTEKERMRMAIQKARQKPAGAPKSGTGAKKPASQRNQKRTN